jgi:hypothetical protein
MHNKILIKTHKLIKHKKQPNQQLQIKIIKRKIKKKIDDFT